MSDNYNADGPYVVWEDSGCEGWGPRSFATLKEAVAHHGYGETLVITKRVEFVVVELLNPDPSMGQKRP